MTGILQTIRDLWLSKTIRKKILITFGLLALYRLLVFLPVPFVNIDNLMNGMSSAGSGLEYFTMLLGWTLEKFSIIAVWLGAYINASIIIQLLTAVVPALEELQEQGETGTQKIQQYTRRLSFPLAFIQSIGMTYFANYLMGGQLIDAQNFPVVLLSAFTMSVGATMLLYIAELITEKGISNGVSLIIFASIISGIVWKIYTDVSAASNQWLWVVVFMLVIVIGLILLSVLILKTTKDVPIIYAKQGKVQESSKLPIPLNPVGMIPIIFAIAFVSFPYLIAQMLTKFGSAQWWVMDSAKWIESNFNIYAQQPSLLIIFIYFALIVAFTFFYAMIVFNPEKMADNVQKRGGFVPGIRPGAQTSAYLSKIISHLCFWGWVGLGLIGIYTYVLEYLPFIQDITQSLGALPVVVTGSGIIIIVWVVQEIMNKVKSDLLMHKYDRI